MADIELTQAEADALIAMEKVRDNNDSVGYPSLGGRVCVPLASADKKGALSIRRQPGKD